MRGAKGIRGKGGKSKNEASSHSVSPSNEGKQKRSRDRSSSSTKDKSQKRRKTVKVTEANASSSNVATRATFEEDGQYFEMEAEGQQTEFIIDNELEEVQEEVSSDEDGEVVFSSQENNNANIVNEEIEEGECSSQESAESTDRGVQSSSKLHKSIDEKIGSSMSELKSYVEEKFSNLNPVHELEKELAENRKKLAELKEKGKTKMDANVSNSLDDDTHTELTIYQNAVEKKRGSSSSEDEVGIGDELNKTEQPDSAYFISE